MAYLVALRTRKPLQGMAAVPLASESSLVLPQWPLKVPSSPAIL